MKTTKESEKIFRVCQLNKTPFLMTGQSLFDVSKICDEIGVAWTRIESTHKDETVLLI